MDATFWGQQEAHVVSVLLAIGLWIKYARPLREVLEVVLQVHQLAAALPYTQLEGFLIVAFHLLVLLVPIV